MRVYLAGAIDHAHIEHLDLFRQASEVIIGALGSGVVIFNPFTAFINANANNTLYNSKDDGYVVKINRLALVESDLGVFVWSGAPSFGLVVEILDRAGTAPMVFLNLSGKKPGIYMRHFMLKCPQVTYLESFEQLDKYLKNFLKQDTVGPEQ